MSFPLAAKAEHYAASPCGGELTAVEDAINAGEFYGRTAETNRTNLLAKLDAANAKVLLTKYADAVTKLQDISDTATAWADATKIKLNPDSATAINVAVGSAQTCIGRL